MKKTLLYCFLLFSFVTVWILTTGTGPTTNSYTISAPVYVPKGAIETELETLSYAQNSARNVLIDHFAKNGVSFGSSASLEIIISYLRAYRQEGTSQKAMDERAKKIVSEFYRYLQIINNKLLDIRRYFAPNPEQIDKLVAAELEPYLRQIDEYLK